MLIKSKFYGAKHNSDCVVLDIYSSDEKNVKTNIRENANFSMNCGIISLKDINAKNWQDKIISLPGTIEDIKNKQIRINCIKHPSGLFACIRFMSKGFKKPTTLEIEIMLKALKKIDLIKFNRNLKKMIRYVGSEEKTRSIIKKLGIKKDVLNFKEIKK